MPERRLRLALSGKKEQASGMSSQQFYVREGKLHCEDCSLERIASSVRTPFYVYSTREVVERFRSLDSAFAAQPHLLCYALKANSQPALLRLLVAEGAGAFSFSFSTGESSRAQFIPTVCHSALSC